MNPDLLLELASRIDNTSLRALYSSSLSSSVRSVISTQYFWYLRAQHLVGLSLLQRPERDWKSTYYGLERCLLENGVLKFTEYLVEDLLAVEILLELGCNPAVDNSIALRISSQKGYADVVKLLLEDGRADPTVYNSNALRISSQNGHVDVVRLLLQDKRADPAADDNSALGLSSISGHVDVVKLLLQDGRADPTAGDSEALRFSSEYGHVEIVKLLLQDGRANPAADDSYALRTSAEKGYTEIVKLLLEDGRADPTVIEH